MSDKKNIGIWGRNPNEVRAHIGHIGLPLELWPNGDCLSAVTIRDKSFVEDGIRKAFEMAQNNGTVQVVALRRELDDPTRQP